MPKWDFDKVAKQLYWSRTSARVFSCKFAAYFQNTFSEEHLRMAASANRCGKYSITASVIQSWNKIQKQLNMRYVKIYPSIKLKQLSVIFILNNIKIFIGPAKIFMTLLVPKMFESNYFNY